MNHPTFHTFPHFQDRFQSLSPLSFHVSLQDAEAIVLEQWESMDDSARASWEGPCHAATPSRRRSTSGAPPKAKRRREGQVEQVAPPVAPQEQVEPPGEWLRPAQLTCESSEEEHDEGSDEEDPA